MKLQRTLPALALGCSLAGAVLARQPPGPAQLIERAEAQVEQGTADPQRDLEPLLRNLRAVRDESARHSLISMGHAFYCRLRDCGQGCGAALKKSKLIETDMADC